MTVTTSRRSPAAIIIAACLAIFCAYVPLIAVAVALPTIQRGLHISTSQLTWVLDALVVAMASFIMLSGTVADLLGRKKVLFGGLILICVGAVLGMSSGSSVELLWAAQAVIGLAAAMLMTSSLAVISHAIPDHRVRGLAIAAWASSLAIGLAAGAWLSALILNGIGAGWTWIFATVLPFALVGMAVALRGVPDSTAHEGRSLDVPGQLASFLLIAGLVFAVIEGPDRGWGSAPVVGGFAVAAAALAAFILRERRAASPMLDLRLFASREFTASAVAAALLMFGLIGTAFILSLFFGTIQHLSMTAIALRFTMILGPMVLIGPAAAQLARRYNPRLPLIAGLAAAGAGILTLTGVHAHDGFAVIWWRLVIVSVGLGLAMSPMTALAVASVPHRLAGLAGSAFNVFRQTGAALGPAVLAAVLTSRVASSLPAALASHHVNQVTSRHVAGLVSAHGLQALAVLPHTAASAPVLAAAGAAFASALHTAAAVAGGAMLAAAAIALILLRHRATTATPYRTEDPLENPAGMLSEVPEALTKLGLVEGVPDPARTSSTRRAPARPPWRQHRDARPGSRELNAQNERFPWSETG
jgi:MFS family permease